ncbi:zinc-binding oxidoreductase [Tothia fuscella]|uniref:Zinc-binding oxidoreductase n=1 Tax=Tothia fuscella TaxID=1048955 RepID=A0A9P4U2U2_9PEZI|nr:zinc-binding oxidoreductase [Tothia fuscella]
MNTLPESFDLPQTMQAWTFRTRGQPTSVLKLSEVPIPRITSPNEVLVRVFHASLNPVGSAMIALLPTFIRKLPAIPELDFSGTVIQAGKSVPAELGPGKAVFRSLPPGSCLRKGMGALAEYVVVPTSNIALKPERLSFEDASGLGITGVTALELVKDSKLKQGDSVLINGASGGVGTMTVQVARNVVGPSGKVVAICSAENAALAKRLGADEVIYRTQHDPVHEYLIRTYSETPFDAIIDAVGVQSVYEHSPQYLCKKGLFVSVGVLSEDLSYASVIRAVLKIASNLYWPRFLGGVARPYLQKTVVVESHSLEGLSVLVQEGKLRVIIDFSFSMNDALHAYDRMRLHLARGKIVIKISE